MKKDKWLFCTVLLREWTRVCMPKISRRTFFHITCNPSNVFVLSVVLHSQNQNIQFCYIFIYTFLSSPPSSSCPVLRLFLFRLVSFFSSCSFFMLCIFISSTDHNLNAKESLALPIPLNFDIFMKVASSLSGVFFLSAGNKHLNDVIGSYAHLCFVHAPTSWIFLKYFFFLFLMKY